MGKKGGCIFTNGSVLFCEDALEFIPYPGNRFAETVFSSSCQYAEGYVRELDMIG